MQHLLIKRPHQFGRHFLAGSEGGLFQQFCRGVARTLLVCYLRFEKQYAEIPPQERHPQFPPGLRKNRVLLRPPRKRQRRLRPLGAFDISGYTLTN